MADDSSVILPPGANHSERQSLVQVPAQSAPTLTDFLSNEWYIRARTEFCEALLPFVKGKIITETEARVVALHEGLKSKYSAYEIQLWPERLVNDADKLNDNLHISYWLIGLPTMPSTELTDLRKYLREWQDQTENSHLRGVKRMVQAKFVPRKVLLEQYLKAGLEKPQMEEALLEPKKETRRMRESFKKIDGSNPAQVRKQFLQHAIGAGASNSGAQKWQSSGGKLRPAKDVLKRLKYDPSYIIEEYVVGYVDRQAGILEKQVNEWQSYEEEELIAYFKHVPKNEIIWDRANKLDWVFNA